MLALQRKDSRLAALRFRRIDLFGRCFHLFVIGFGRLNGMFLFLFAHFFCRCSRLCSVGLGILSRLFLLFGLGFCLLHRGCLHGFGLHFGLLLNRFNLLFRRFHLLNLLLFLNRNLAHGSRLSLFFIVLNGFNIRFLRGTLAVEVRKVYLTQRLILLFSSVQHRFCTMVLVFGRTFLLLRLLWEKFVGLVAHLLVLMKRFHKGLILRIVQFERGFGFHLSQLAFLF